MTRYSLDPDQTPPDPEHTLPPPDRTAQGTYKTWNVLCTIFGVVGEVLATCGLILLLFVAWELWGTNIAADHSQQQAVHRFAHEFTDPRPAPVPRRTSPVNYGPPKVGATPAADGQVFGVVYIPRLGPDYSRPLVQGTSIPVLDTLGLGHYNNTAMPGEVGNFVVAGHRQTHGAVLDHIDTLVPGDKIYVQTRQGYYTYVFRNEEIVLPTQTNVLLPVPTQKDAKPTQAYMTMTSCNPKFGSQERIIAYSVLKSWQPASAGPPAAIAHQVNTAAGKG
jgi:sortase A